MKERTPLVILTFLITFIAIANLVRLFWNIPIMIGTFVLPGWTGSIAYVACALLAAWSFRALCFVPRVYPLNPEKAEVLPQPSASIEKPRDYPKDLN